MSGRHLNPDTKRHLHELPTALGLGLIDVAAFWRRMREASQSSLGMPYGHG